MRETADDQEPLLRVKGLGKRHGVPCARCGGAAGSTAFARRCLQCGSLWGCFDIDFDLFPGEILGIVGESGSGKSTLLSCLCFDQEATQGEAVFSTQGWSSENILALSSQEKRYVRNRHMGMVYQNALLGLRMNHSSSANIAEKLIAAGSMRYGAMRARAGELLDRMEISSERMDESPKQFSGGMQQRVQIARAMANHPELLLLDEITSGLDLTVQARVLDLVREIQRESNVTMLIVSHDLGVIRLLCDRCLVMRGGTIIERGLTDQILQDPQHEYTQLLVHSLL